MNRKLRTLGVAVIAVLAVSAASAVAANAANFTSEAASTYIHGVQSGENTFTTKAGNVKCKTATFASVGNISGTSNTTVQVHPTYASCTAFGQSATVTTTGCDFLLSADGTFDFANASGTTCTSIVVEVASAPCTVTVYPTAPGVRTMDYTNNKLTGKERDILVTSTVSQIDYEVSQTGICGTKGRYKGTEGAAYDGSVTVKGWTDSTMGTQVGIWVD